MQTSLKTGFAQIFSCCPNNLSCPKFGGAAAPLAPPQPVAYVHSYKYFACKTWNSLPEKIRTESTLAGFKRLIRTISFHRT